MSMQVVKVALPEHAFRGTAESDTRLIFHLSSSIEPGHLSLVQTFAVEIHSKLRYYDISVVTPLNQNMLEGE